MSSLDVDRGVTIKALERERRLAYDASIVARAEYQSLAAKKSVSAEALDLALERLERAESRKASIMNKIEQLEDQLVGGGA